LAGKARLTVWTTVKGSTPSLGLKYNNTVYILRNNKRTSLSQIGIYYHGKTFYIAGPEASNLNIFAFQIQI
jgi:hypothetical protein